MSDRTKLNEHLSAFLRENGADKEYIVDQLSMVLVVIAEEDEEELIHVEATDPRGEEWVVLVTRKEDLHVTQA